MPSSAFSPIVIYTLFLHDALPIYRQPNVGGLFVVWLGLLYRLAGRTKEIRGVGILCRGTGVLHIHHQSNCTVHAILKPDPHSLGSRSEEHTSELQSLRHLVCRLLLSLPSSSTLFSYTTLFRSIASPTLAGFLLFGWACFIVWLAERKKSEVLGFFAVALAYYTSIISPIARFTLYSNLILTVSAVDRKSTRLNSSHLGISYAVFCFLSHRHLHSFPTRRSSDLSPAQRWRAFCCLAGLALSFGWQNERNPRCWDSLPWHWRTTHPSSVQLHGSRYTQT